MTDAARTRRDDPRFEPQLTVPGRDSGSADPLAELARLVGQDDPFRNVFRPAAAQPARAPAVEVEHRVDAAYHPAVDGPELDHHDHDAAYRDGSHAADDHHGHAHDDPYEGQHGYDDPHDDRYYATEQAAHPDEAGIADERLTPVSAAAAIPDLWARGEDPTWSEPEDAHGAARLDQARLGRSSARRPLAVLAAVLLLTGGGLAATFLARSTSATGTVSAASNRAAPTIMAATGPTKVKVDDGSGTAPEDQDAALLNKNGNVSSGPVKIVSSQEQPADLDQLPEADLAEGARLLPPPAASPFPEPKKVKTFLVHPDGTMLSSDTGAAPVGPGPVASGAGLSVGDDATASAQPATPRTAAKGGTTPTSAASGATIASLAAEPAPAVDPAPAAKPARQPASPGVRASATKPNDTAAGAPASGGSFGLQLASSPVEAEANAAFARLKKKYPSQLGAYTATVHRADTGDKPVYRVRVGGMSQDEAKGLCAQLQTAGGSCFVVHN